MNRAKAVTLMFEYYRKQGYNPGAITQMVTLLGKSDVDGLVAYAVDQAIDHYEAEIKKHLGQMAFLLEEEVKSDDQQT